MKTGFSRETRGLEGLEGPREGSPDLAVPVDNRMVGGRTQAKDRESVQVGDGLGGGESGGFLAQVPKPYPAPPDRRDQGFIDQEILTIQQIG